jgi:hypothetical protein
LFCALSLVSALPSSTVKLSEPWSVAILFPLHISLPTSRFRSVQTAVAFSAALGCGSC